MESLWRMQTGKILWDGKKQPERVDEKKYDVIVVGAGLAGLLTAYYLKEQGKKVVVLEANTIASGQTERTTAKITSQHGLKYSRLIKVLGRKKAKMYAQANEAAILEYERLIQTQGISCDFRRVPAYLYSLQDEKGLRDEAEAASELGIDAAFTQETELPFAVTGAVCYSMQAQFAPLAFVKHIAKDLEICEHTKVIAIRGQTVFMENAVMVAEKIVVTTHYPIRNIPGFYFLRQHQERSYVVALSGCEKMEGMYYGIDKGGLSFRQAGEYLLLGGGSHRTGKKGCGGAYENLFKVAKEMYPNARVETYWSAQDCMSHDGVPFVGQYSIFTPQLYVATGFGKWGMTSAMVAAMILRDKLCGRENPYEKVFSPCRMYFRAGILQWCVDVGMSTAGLLKGIFARPRCSHMGCNLVWNEDEHSWDCPCHGSRFSEAGKLLDNPSKNGIEVENKKKHSV